MYRDKDVHTRDRMFRICNLRDEIKKNPKKYEQVFKFALDNWNDLVQKARKDIWGDECVSIADQIEVYTNCSRRVAEDIANSISLSKAISRK